MRCLPAPLIFLTEDLISFRAPEVSHGARVLHATSSAVQATRHAAMVLLLRLRFAGNNNDLINFTACHVKGRLLHERMVQ